MLAAPTLQAPGGGFSPNNLRRVRPARRAGTGVPSTLWPPEQRASLPWALRVTPPGPVRRALFVTSPEGSDCRGHRGHVPPPTPCPPQEASLALGGTQQPAGRACTQPVLAHHHPGPRIPKCPLSPSGVHTGKLRLQGQGLHLGPPEWWRQQAERWQDTGAGTPPHTSGSPPNGPPDCSPALCGLLTGLQRRGLGTQGHSSRSAGHRGRRALPSPGFLLGRRRGRVRKRQPELAQGLHQPPALPAPARPAEAGGPGLPCPGL